MIKGKKSLELFERNKQEYETRLGLFRFGFNEYVPHIVQGAYDKLLSNLTAEQLSSYPEVNIAYDLLSKKLGYDKEFLLFNFGADGCIRMVMEAFCEHGDKVGLILPTYGLYPCYIQMNGGTVYPIEYDSPFCIDVKKVLGALDSGLKILCMANPNGIWGNSINKLLIEEIVANAQKKDVLVVVDEAYADFGVVSFLDLVKKYDNIIVLRSFSKSYGMAGVRVGFSVANPTLTKWMFKVKPNVEITSVGVEVIKLYCSENDVFEDAISQIKASRSKLVLWFKNRNIEVYDTDANFIVFRLQVERVTSFLSKCNDFGVELKNIGEGYIRMTVAVGEYLERGLQYIKIALEETSNGPI